ncbi:hypothetical protein [Nocardia cyriacigeorgica]|uniref:hypothetical protein n=1 Tax=Nocardia cyriacigeorgica TaxID=135487 RepID=UPI0013D8BDCC|nr:hypothetical protein [Nocardia cyriacigeorgica]NEW29472.1 hypothetical protein [Nocardia cyriacigeorgica]
MIHDRYHYWTGEIRSIVQAGCTVTDRYNSIQQRLSECLNDANPYRQQLINAVVNPEIDANIPELIALSQAYSNSSHGNDDVLKVALDALIADYRTNSSQQNWNLIKRKFDNAAQRFTKAVQIIDPDESAETIVKLSEKERQAWMDGKTLAAELDSYVPVIRSLFYLSGRHIVGRDSRLPLIADTDTVEPELIWSAYDEKNSWKALAEAGVKIRMLDKPEDYRTLNRPAAE